MGYIPTTDSFAPDQLSPNEIYDRSLCMVQCGCGAKTIAAWSLLREAGWREVENEIHCPRYPQCSTFRMPEIDF